MTSVVVGARRMLGGCWWLVAGGGEGSGAVGRDLDLRLVGMPPDQDGGKIGVAAHGRVAG